MPSPPARRRARSPRTSRPPSRRVSRYSYAGSESATTPRAGLHVRDAVLDHDRADVDAGVEVARVAQVADRAAVEAALRRLELVDDLHRADLRRARQRARGQARRAARPSRRSSGRSVPDHRRDDVHHVRVGLDRHQLADLDACRTRTRARGRCGPGRRASRARRAPSRRAAAPRATRRSSSGLGRARARAGDRAHLGAAAGHLHAAAPATRPRSRSRRTRGSTCRARGSRRAGRGRPRTARPGRARSSAATGTTWKASPAKMYSFARSTAASYSALGHVRLERARAGSAGRGPGAAGARDRLARAARARARSAPPPAA